MRRLFCVAALALLTSVPVAVRQAEEPSPIKEIMEALNKGPQALTSSIGRNLEKAEPDWQTLAEQCVTYLDKVEQLGRNVPPRGEPASWGRLTRAYLEDARMLALAVRDKDRQAALDAHGKIEQACARCHVSHKP